MSTRDADAVSQARIECWCGWVVELTGWRAHSKAEDTYLRHAELCKEPAPGPSGWPVRS